MSDVADLTTPVIGRNRSPMRGALHLFWEDIRANMAPGPASLAKALIGLVFCPGLICVILHRISAWAYGKGSIGKLFGLLIWRFNVLMTGAYLHPSAKIGSGLRLPHPIGVVVGQGVVVGANVTLYQNTTLGISSQASWQLYPVIGDGAVVYCGAVIVGGLRIGANATIGANAVVLKDVPDSALAVGIPARICGPQALMGNAL